MPNAELLGTVASIITAAAVAALFFRIQRELYMREVKNERGWIAVADWLLIGASLIAVFAVLVPLLLAYESTLFGLRIPIAGCVASAVALGGYAPAILAHYKLFREGPPRKNPEDAEVVIVGLTTAGAVMAAIASLITTADDS